MYIKIYILIYSCDCKVEFSAIYSSLQCHMIIISVKN